MKDDPVVYVPRMSDHALTVVGAMRSMGIRAEVLPPPDDESLAIGLDLCHGRECLPCFLCTGDMLRKCREPDFDPSRAVFFMPTGPGPCRFGQYGVLQKMILTEEGFGEARLVSPSTNDSYALFGDDPLLLRKRAWQAIAAVDLLARVLHEHRPYETVPGAADGAYEASLGDLVDAAEAGGGGVMVRALARAAERFGGLAVDRSVERPRVAVVGELYLMLSARGNMEMVRAVERSGGEAVLGTFMDWLHFVDWRRKDLAIRFHRWHDLPGAALSDAYQRWVVRRFVRPLRPVLRHPDEAPVAGAMRLLETCYEPVLGTEAVLTMGRVLDLGRHGIAGVINVLPFYCMPGSIVACMAPRLRDRMGGVPWLDVAFDGQRETNLQTRLEAFMHQAVQFHRRSAGARAEGRPRRARAGGPRITDALPGWKGG